MLNKVPKHFAVEESVQFRTSVQMMQNACFIISKYRFAAILIDISIIWLRCIQNKIVKLQEQFIVRI